MDAEVQLQGGIEDVHCYMNLYFYISPIGSARINFDSYTCSIET